INRYIAEHNRSPKPFIWTKPASAIFDALSRAPEPSV
ncbi:IS630 family transposase, partial [Methylobacterium sp. J-078]|nr:IS630 family transposase [Methylobacterium sp. J-078]